MLGPETKSTLRNTLFFGTTLLLMLTANFVTLFGDYYYEAAADLMFAACVLLDVSILCDLIPNVRRDFALLVFVGTYNILLLGRVFVCYAGGYADVLTLLEADSFKNLFAALQIVTLSLFFVYLAYRLSAPLFFRREKRMREDGAASVSRNPLLPVIRKISVAVLLVSSIASFYALFESILNVRQSGYLNSFLNPSVEIPSGISRLSMFFVPSFAVFLATLPDRKQMKLPMFVYGVYMLASIFTGRRTTFVCEALMITIYFVMRDSLRKKEDRVLKKKTVGWLAVLTVAAMYLLQLFAVIRAGVENTSKSFGSMLVSFFNSQGASFRVVVQTVKNWDLFDHNVSYLYLFYPFEVFVHNNAVTSTLFGLSPIVETQNTQFVQSTHNYAHVLTYLVDPARYLSGGGFGTSYVAEAYVAYGIAGVIAVSVMLGLIFRFLSSLLTRSWVVIACGLIGIKEFVYMPRSFAFLWVTNVFSITYFCFYIAVYLAALFLVRVGTHIFPARAGRFRREEGGI